MNKAQLENAIYKIMIDELEPRETEGILRGNAHHIAQKLTASVLIKILEFKKSNTISSKTQKMIDSSMKNLAKGKTGKPIDLKELKDSNKNYIACYKKKEDWNLITREISTLKHAKKKSELYKKAGYTVKILSLDL
jgi:hypothetical protein